MIYSRFTRSNNVINKYNCFYLFVFLYSPLYIINIDYVVSIYIVLL